MVQPESKRLLTEGRAPAFLAPRISDGGVFSAALDAYVGTLAETPGHPLRTAIENYVTANDLGTSDGQVSTLVDSTTSLTGASVDARARAVVPELARNLTRNPRALLDLQDIGVQGGSGTTLSRISGRRHGTAAQAVTDGTAQFQGMFFVTDGLGGVAGRYRVTAEVTASVTGTYRFSAWTMGAYGEFPFTLSAGQTREVTWEFQYDGTTDSAVYVDTSIEAKATTIVVESIILTKAEEHSAFFDGDFPGCRWSGVRGRTASIRMTPEHSQALMHAPELVRNLCGQLRSRWHGAGGAGTADTWQEPDFEGQVVRKLWSTAPTGTSEDTGFTFDDGSLTERISVTPGVRYYPSASVRANKGQNVQLVIHFYDSTNTYVSGVTLTDSFAVLTPNAKSTIRSDVGFVPPIGITKATVILYVGLGGNGIIPWEVGDYFVGGEAIVSTKPSDFFDGDSPGCRWVGTPRFSESVRQVLSPREHSLLTWLDAGLAQGTGSPEGVVTARVGTRYVDTAATNGAIEWIKASGAGSTGWKVAHGDTGWRNLAPINGWVASSFQIRRHNDIVDLRVQALGGSAATAETLAPCPPGFGPGGSNPIFAPTFVVASGLVDADKAWTIDATGIIVRGAVPNVVTSWSSVTYGTSEPWPTVLPGTPA